MVYLKHKFAKISLGIYLILNLVFAPVVNATEIIISDNGTGSDNSVSMEVGTTTIVEQTNNVNVENNVTVNSNTGDNVASDNSGDFVEITTGSTTTNIGIENNLNTSTASVSCCESNLSAEINGNGTGSGNNINVIEASSTTASINQTATVINTVQGHSNTGRNTADNNNGNVSITTGKIEIIGKIINGPINTSIINLPSGTSGFNAKVGSNGSDSKNAIFVDLLGNSSLYIINNAYLINDVNWDLETGKNVASDNNGNVSIDSGDILFDFFISNNANINITDITCCDIFDPGEPEEKQEEEEETPEEEVNEEDSDDDNDDDGEILDEAAAIEAGGPGIAGLSDTSSENAQTLFFWAGLIMMILGVRFIGQNISSKKLEIFKN